MKSIIQWINMAKQIISYTKGHSQKLAQASAKPEITKKVVQKWIFLNNVINKIKKLKNISGSQWVLLSIIGLLCIYAIYYYIKKYYSRPPKTSKKTPSRQNSRLHMSKKNASLVSLKQYESHSNSGLESDSSNYTKIKQVKKTTKQYKQYCTDIDTDIQKQGQLQQKRDKFFFTLIGSYQSHKDTKQQGIDIDQLQYDCEYDQSQQVSPERQVCQQPKQITKMNKIILN